nr:cysteine synthase family protein [Clostridia bacterium]
MQTALDYIGGTPLIRLRGTESALGLGCQLYGKAESFNPSGSIKDRAARSILLGAMARGEIKNKGVVIDASSGNMGISLSMLGALLGLTVKICIPEGVSSERIALIRAYGAEAILIRGDMSDAISRAKSLSESEGCFYPNQFINPDNPKAHSETTAPEIFTAMDEDVDYLVCGVGTGGTLLGIADYFNNSSRKTKLIAVEPAGSAVLSGGCAGAHGIQGIGAGFIPPFFKRELVEDIICVTDSDAVYYSRLVAVNDGLAVGYSSGAAVAAVKRLSELTDTHGKRVVAILPDSIDRYLSK